jgi:plasmid stabilization system protein ParE
VSFSVELTPRAYQDINEIVDYIADQSGTARAENIRLRIIAGLKLLEGMPTI